MTTVGEAKSDAEINLMIGKRLNPEAWPWDNIEDMLSCMIESTGMTFPEMREKAPVYLPFEHIELWSTFYDACGLDPMPYFEEPDPGPGATPELMEEYPFVLTTGARRWSSFHSEHRQIKRLRRMDPWPYIEVHPETAEKLGVTDGEWVWVENPLGRAKRTIKITPIVDPRVVSCDHGWWLRRARCQGQAAHLRAALPGSLHGVRPCRGACQEDGRLQQGSVHHLADTRGATEMVRRPSDERNAGDGGIPKDTYVLSFLMGGFYCLIGQIFLTIWGLILGPAFGMPATLLSMGVVGVILYITGIHQKLAPHTGWGSILVFNGFACALANEYEEGAGGGGELHASVEEGGAGKGVCRLLDLFFWVVGTGALIAIIVAVAAYFMA